ncbi:tRNA (adenosine(37)-N6)-dimethylallyltransferase MiaA [Phenylobacterium sp.]|uniref:tRNA (adenosine(37)-N6)-dimethylallyltransferase MiaA n=3 Tax=Phenylobacterium sp. TaxID=1871053 RepID=UPI0025F76992|nr:tRNA (adenosine(37)-N6)-dimethylallyltransferase MiaA [Phenylobacterium sp.]MCA3741223.1 tRNA (adenosine(37)-N6)-dimethylallyltransferase MiaA [Phenylobacterium sp.]
MASRIWLIAGPTASGKSALALRLAQMVGGEIIGADALQIYRDLPVLTAAADAADRAEVRHHLVGTVDAAEAWSTGRWLAAARQTLADLAARETDAVVAGGTGLYFEALVRGLAEIPSVPAGVRLQVGADFTALGEAAFRERLAGVDPAAADRILPGDRQRLCRAWEVYAATGRALSDWQAEPVAGLAPDSWRGVRLMPPRGILYRRGDDRFAAMVASGALDEVQALAARRLDPALPACKAVGVRPLIAFLDGALALEAAIADGQRETRNYVKRQEVWLRGRMASWPAITDIDPDDQWRSFLALNPDLTA